MKKNRRIQSFALLILAAVLLAVIAVLGSFWQEAAIRTDFTRKNLAPCIQYPFGTDWMGRDMFVRTVAGLSLSIRIGLLTAAVSAVMAFILGLSAAVFGKFVDSAVRLLIDIVMGIPHMLLLILISFACGRGFWGVVCGIAFTHWASLARLIRGEVLQLKQSQYVKIAEKLGKGKFYIAFSHMAPNLVPQFITGLVLMFPHAILHHVPGLRSVFRESGRRSYPFGKHEISGYGKMVAGAVPGTFPRWDRASVSLYRTGTLQTFGSGQCS